MVKSVKLVAIFATGLLIGYLSGYMWHLVTVKTLQLNGNQIIYGLHFHHSLLAIFPLIVAFYYRKDKIKMVILLAIAAGIILEHRLTYKDWLFITQTSKP